MQNTNLNQQSALHPKRQCISYKQNDFFSFLDQYRQEIIHNYQRNTESMMIQSLAILIDRLKFDKNTDPQSLKKGKMRTEDIMYSLSKNKATFKKQNPHHQTGEQESTNPQQQLIKMVNFQKTGQKQTKSIRKVEFCVQEKGQQYNLVQTKKHEKLINSLKRLSVADEFRELEEQIQNFPDNRKQRQDTYLLKTDEDLMKNKSISDLLKQSQAKPKTMAQKQLSPPQDSESQYEITDHESNQSSHGDDYEERFAYQTENAPLFGTIFAGTGKTLFSGNIFGKKNQSSTDSVQHMPHPKLTFKPLLNSPKKQKTKKKRLYINKKKVPKWAQDLRQLQKIFSSENQTKLRQQHQGNFGICVVQDLRTNCIFSRNDEYVRASTAKWQKRKGGYVV